MEHTEEWITTNILKARLGATFYCFECKRTHAKESKALTQCLTTFARHISYPLERSWSIDTIHYYRRLSWRTHNNLPWSESNAQEYNDLIVQLGHLAFHDSVPLARRTELADPHGAIAFRARFNQWLTPWIQRCQQANDAAAPLLARFEALLSPPFPVGTPTGILTQDGTLVPDPLSHQEIQRVYTLLGTKTTLTSTKQDITLSLNCRAPSRRRNVSQAQYVCIMLSSFREIDYAKYVFSRAWFAADELGLDSNFWTSIRLNRSILSLRTQEFTLHD